MTFRSFELAKKIATPQFWFLLGNNLQIIEGTIIARIVCTYENLGTTQILYPSGTTHKITPRDKQTLDYKVQLNPKTTAEDWGRSWRLQIPKYVHPLFRVHPLHHHGLKVCHASDMPLLQDHREMLEV